MSKIEWEKMSMAMIVEIGQAKTYAMEALALAKKKKFNEAKKKIDESEKFIGNASHMHFNVIQEEAKGSQLEFRVLFLHAEDQLLTTQTLILIINEFIDLYKII